tara:strand:- start:10046 stop:11080 length:1035 start_codon:yes stop_codon:yes gene_type:complete
MIKKNFIKIIIILPIIFISSYSGYLYYHIQTWKYKGPEKTFIIKPGEGFSSINHRLSKENFISSPVIFFRLSKVKNILTSFKVGHFSIKPGMNMTEIIQLLTTGVGKSIRVTIQEGKNLYEISKILSKKNVIKSAERFISLTKSNSLTKKLGIKSINLEGYLYPDTYNFPPQSESEYVISKMVKNFFNKIKNVKIKTDKFTLNEIVILSSIVEKETGASFERPIIAGVFINRLKKKMRLQSDPTTIYGIYESFNGNLKKKHLRQKTDYNTYKINGLPVGAISNPGIDSIKAVLNPTNHNYLYFVSQNDGTHIFTTNYRDHQAAVNKWQKNARNRKGKSWRQLKK